MDSQPLSELMQEAHRVYEKHFSKETCFERAVFFSWGCTIMDCSFCYMSTQPKEKAAPETRRSTASILAEFLLAKHCGWEIGFFSGGIGVLKPKEFLTLLENIHKITKEKIWINVGPVAKPLLELYKPYIKGVVGSIETMDPKLHKEVCPSKPIAPYVKMFQAAKELGLENGMTIILGLGETRKDFVLLEKFIQENSITKIHLYSLIPHKGTPFARSKIISKEEQAWWIAKLRIAFPQLDIQFGIWEDRIDRISFLLSSGANSISKFKATKLFGTKLAQEIETQAKVAKRTFRGTLTKIPDIDWEKEILLLHLEQALQEEVKEKLELYLQKMQKNKKVSSTA